MKKEVQGKLDQLFEKKKQVDDLRSLEADQKRMKEIKAEQDFEGLCESVIKPSMTAMGSYLESKGFAYEIVKGADEFVVRGGLPGQPEMTFLISTTSARPIRGIASTPYFKVLLHKEKASVTFQVSTITRDRGGSTASAGEVALKDMTQDILEGKIAEVILQVFKPL
jgi:hypothetical protein